MLLTPSFYKDVSGHQIAFYESIGRSDVLVFLVHGNSCNASYFKKQLESPLGEKYHFISFDFPGHGNSAWSEAPENTYCIKGFADILTEIIRAYNKPCLVVSHSLGANIALFAGANMNSCIKGFFCSGLTLIDTPDDASQALLPNEALPLFFQQDLTHAERIRMAMSELFLKRDDDI